MAYSIHELIKKNGDIIKSGFIIRKVEERILQLFSEGKINGTVHTCIGQELIGPCIAQELEDDDVFVSNHRGHGHYIAKTGDIEGLMAEIMGKETGICRGFGGSQHLFTDHFISNGIQGGMVPIAAGMAMGFKLSNIDRIAVSFIGDGTLGEGILYETLNLSGLWNIPVLFILENNGYAQSTSIKQTFSGILSKRIEGFGIQYDKTQTWDLDHLTSKVRAAVNYVKKQRAPFFLEIETYRLKAHSKGDDNRNINEIKDYKAKDLLNRISSSNLPEVNEMLSEIDAEIDAVLGRISESSVSNFRPAEPPKSQPTEFTRIPQTAEKKRINELIYEVLKDYFQNNDRAVMIGEDIEYSTTFTSEPYGGAFKVSRDLSDLFDGRIRNTPISEAAIVGLGTGMALSGMKPIVEIMFGDFISLTFDQILNHACKFPEIYGRKVPVPLVIRTPMGGRRGYGPTHSQSLEKYLIGIPNLYIYALNHRHDPREIYQKILSNSDNPGLVIENKILYTRYFNNKKISGFEIQQNKHEFPTIRIIPAGNLTPDLSIVCYGGMLEEVEEAIQQAFDELELLCEVICPSLIHPVDIEPVIQSVNKSAKLLIVEEGSSIAAFGTEILTLIIERGIKINQFCRLGNDGLVPCSFDAEKDILPSSDSILAKIRQMTHE